MVIIMETSSGKILDEACNHYNDVYRDEVLYSSWAAAPHVAAGLATVAPAGKAPVSGHVVGLMASLYAGRE